MWRRSKLRVWILVNNDLTVFQGCKEIVDKYLRNSEPPLKKFRNTNEGIFLAVMHRPKVSQTCLIRFKGKKMLATSCAVFFPFTAFMQKSICIRFGITIHYKKVSPKAAE